MYAVACHPERRHRGRSHRLPGGRRAPPDRRQRLEHRQGLPALRRARRRALPDRRRLRADRPDRLPGPQGRPPPWPAFADANLATLPSFSFLIGRKVAGRAAWIARTGYTGEDGFEIFCAAEDAPATVGRPARPPRRPWAASRSVWARATRCAWRRASRSTATTSTTPPRRSRPASAGWSSSTRATSSARRPCCASRAAGLPRKLVGFEMRERGIARHGYAILDAQSGARLGVVTSGTVGPTVGKNIGMGYVPPSHAEPGTRIVIDCRGKPAQAEVSKGPFYRRPATPSHVSTGARRNMSDNVPERSPLHRGPRVGPPGRQPGHRRHLPVRRRATGRRHPGRPAARGRGAQAERALRLRRIGQGGLRPVRAGLRQGGQGQHHAAGLARIRERGSLRRRLDDPDRDVRAPTSSRS